MGEYESDIDSWSGQVIGIYMFINRIIKWIVEAREWSREHDKAWKGVTEPAEDGLSLFQRKCEEAVTKAIQAEGGALIGREIQGVHEKCIKARIKDSPWTLWIYGDAAQVISEGQELVNLECWDAKTPNEFIAIFVEKVVADIIKRKNS